MATGTGVVAALSGPCIGPLEEAQAVDAIVNDKW